MAEITLYTAPTANGFKISIALEEMAISYSARCLDFQKNEQKTPEFLVLNPNGRIPVIVDHQNNEYVLSESGAILLYLAERSGMLFPESLEARYEVMQWLMFQMSAVGPMMGQAMFFQRIAAPKGIVDEYATKRYVDESRRLLTIANERLSERDYLCGDYSIADIAMFPWARAYRWGNIDIDNLVHLREWFELIESRDAVQRGIRVPTGEIPIAYSSDSDLSEATRQNANKYDA